jgi:hypothetical protein
MYITSGSILLGLTKKTHCNKCNNLCHFQVRQESVQQQILLINMKTYYAGIYTLCSICNVKKDLITYIKFTSSSKLEEVRNLLEGGKEETLKLFNQLNQNQKTLILERLNAIKAYSIVKYFSNYKD